MSNIYCRVRGFRCTVEKQIDDMLCILIFNNYKRFPLKTESVDRGIERAWVKMSDVECIWTEKNYEEVIVIYGEIRVSKDEVPTIIDTCDTKYCKNHHYAIHNGREYINFIGFNNNLVYSLSSYDINSQEDGFIMDSPGLYKKRVSPERIEAAYQSHTWCVYNGLKLIVNEDRDNILTIEPYGRNDYPDKVLTDLGFYIKNTKYTKDINVNDLESIWVENIPHENFIHMKFEPVPLKGIIPDLL